MNDDTPLSDSYALSEEQLEALGLREHPFKDHADEAYLYTDSQLEMTANIIMEYLTNPTTTIVLLGENGLGKTTYLRKVLRLGYQQYQFCTLRATADTEFDAIENKIKQRWHLNDTHEQSPVADLSIENYVILYLKEYPHAVLIIDDAHLLHKETLDRLFTLKHRIGLACPTSLGFILAGENILKVSIADLEDSNPACTQVYQINVRPFSYEQTKNYLDHRLAVAGLEGDVLFDEAKITEIYKASGGNVKQIHEQAIRSLQGQGSEATLSDFNDPNIIIRRPKPRIPVLFLTLLAILAVGLYINFKISNDTQEETAIPLDTPANAPTLSPIAQESHQPKNLQTPSLPLPTTPDIKKSELNNQAPLLNSDLAGKDGETTSSPKLPSLLAESIETLDEKQLAGLKESLTKVAESSRENKSKASDQSAKPVTVKEGDQSSASPEYGVTWLKGLDPSHYTLQVVATQERSQLEALIKQVNLKKDYAYFNKPVKGNTYYVLVVGDYSNRSEALSAVASLPGNLKKNKPWPVSIQSIKQFVE